MPNADLMRHNESQFRRSIVKLAPGIWTAVGYAASTQHLIEGESSLTVVDTSESTEAAQNVLAEFRQLSDKPVGRIIYTHSHRDHISGASVFSEGQDIPVIASAAFDSDPVSYTHLTLPTICSV